MEFDNKVAYKTRDIVFLVFQDYQLQELPY
jgi:hypothetical protein